MRAPATAAASGSRSTRSSPEPRRLAYGARRRSRVLRRRSAGRRGAGLCAAAAAARDGGCDPRDARIRRLAGGRGGHRHRKDLCLPRPGADRWRQGDHLHRHQAAAGPAVRPRLADSAAGPRLRRYRRVAQGALQLRLPTPHGAGARRSAPGDARGRQAPAADRALRAFQPERRPRRSGGGARGRGGVAACHLDARELPRPGMPALQGLLRDARARTRSPRTWWL